jgi:hypothetical protein
VALIDATQTGGAGIEATATWSTPIQAQPSTVPRTVSVTEVESEVSATPSLSTASPVLTEASTPVVVVTGESGDTNGSLPVMLHYDSNSLSLVNESTRRVDVSALSFVQTTADGRTLRFESNTWEQDANKSLYGLTPGDCFQVFRDDYPVTTKPDYCESRQGWRRVAVTRYFWISNDPQATFEVRWGSKVQVVCKIADGICAFDPRSP